MLKHHLTTSPLLAFPWFDVEFTLDCDASSEGLGAVLSQTHDRREHVISYASRSLTKAECQYCATRRELLALVWGCQQFRPYLYRRYFTVRTDHNALKWLKNFKEPEGQVARWLQILSEYDFQVEHRPGKQHLNADALSRNHCRQCGSEQLKTAERYHTSVLTVSAPEQESWLSTWNIDDFRLQQQANSSLHQMTKWLEDNSLPQSFPKSANEDLQALWNQRHNLKLIDGVLYCQWKDIPNGGMNAKLQVVLPQHLIPDVMSQLHDSPTGGHLGVAKTLEKI